MEDEILWDKHAFLELGGDTWEGLEEWLCFYKVEFGPLLMEGAGGGEYEVIAAAGVGDAGVWVLEVELLEFRGFVLEGVGESVVDLVEELLVELFVHDWLYVRYILYIVVWVEMKRGGFWSFLIVLNW